MFARLNRLLFPHDRREDHLKQLDGLRGIAVLFVLLSHSSNEGLFFHENLNFKGIGKIGVYLFFVLSAYLLDYQTARAFIMGKANKGYWKNYLLRRFLRIYPLFFFALLYYYLFSLWGYETVIDVWEDIPLHLLLMKGESIFWSIPVEFKYYAISPIILFCFFRYLKWKAKLLSIFLIGLIVTSILATEMLTLSSISTTRYFSIFLAGTGVAVLTIFFPKQTKSKYINFLALLAFLIILISTPSIFINLIGLDLNIHDSKYFFPYAFLWSIILFSSLRSEGFVKRIFSFKPLRLIGNVSFSLYLTHIPILRISSQSDFIPQELRIYFFFALALVVSVLSYLVIERPISKIRIIEKE